MPAWPLKGAALTAYSRLRPKKPSFSAAAQIKHQGQGARDRKPKGGPPRPTEVRCSAADTIWREVEQGNGKRRKEKAKNK